MPLHEHEPTLRGRAFLWGGIGLGLLFLAVVLTKGFGLLGGPAKGAEEPASMVRQGNKILVPEGSMLRSRLSVMPAAAQSVEPKLTFPGIVDADPARTVAIFTPLSGRVTALKVGLGERVSRGQVLAVLDSPDLGQALDDDDKAADTARLTETNLKRQEAQNTLGVASDRDLDQARSEYAQAAAEYTRTQARLKSLGITAADRPSRLLQVIAPISGSITALAVAPGALINDPAQPMLSIADLSTVWVTALVPEKDIAAVSKDEQAEVSLLAYPGRMLRGKVLFVSAVVEPDSRRNKIRIAFANQDEALKPNMFATVTLTGSPRTAVVVPSSALLMNNDRTSVFVATAPWTFERRIVDTQLEEGSSVAIHAGVAPGEMVVVKGGILLND
jgi:cobalt-zinc-cadmium efflux system membrane fusion protein